YRRWTEQSLPSSLIGYRKHALGWAAAHFRARLRDPDWTSFTEDADMVAVAVIAAFRDLSDSWGHHPLFGAMIRATAAQGCSLHAMATFGAAKSMASAGNRVAFPADGFRHRVISFHVLLGGQDQMSVAVRPCTRFEWPDGAPATPRLVGGEVIDA